MLRAVVAFILKTQQPRRKIKKKKSLSAELLEDSFDLFRKTVKNFTLEKANFLELPHYTKFCPF